MASNKITEKPVAERAADDMMLLVAQTDEGESDPDVRRIGVRAALEGRLLKNGGAVPFDEMANGYDFFVPRCVRVATGSPANFDGGVAGLPFAELSVDIPLSQAGSGDPSPTNVRAISGIAEVDVAQSGADTSYVALGIHYNFGETLYNATLDVRRGRATEPWIMVDDLGTNANLDWQYNSSRHFFYAPTHGTPIKMKAFSKMFCSHYKYVGVYTNFEGEDYACGYTSGTMIAIKDTRYTDVDTFKAALSGVQLVYELDTMRTITLSAGEFEVLAGVNNIWSDAGDVTAVYEVASPRAIEGIKIGDIIIPAENGIADITAAIQALINPT